MICKKGDKFAICIGLYDEDIEDFRKAVKIYEKQGKTKAYTEQGIGRAMLNEKIAEILKESENND